MRRPRQTLTRAAIVVFAASLLAAISVASARRSRTSPRPARTPRTRSAASDFVAPSASRSVIGKVSGGIPGYIRQGGSYHVYAQVTDTGNPASGVSTVTANTSAFASGVTAAALAAGSFTIGGLSYNYRTATLTANASIAPGTHTYSLTLTDVGGNTRTQTGFTVTVDNTAPTATDIQSANVAAIAGRPELNDTITFTFSEPIEPSTVLAGWTGAQTDVVVRINNNTAGASTTSCRLQLGQHRAAPARDGQPRSHRLRRRQPDLRRHRHEIADDDERQLDHDRPRHCIGSGPPVRPATAR